MVLGDMTWLAEILFLSSWFFLIFSEPFVRCGQKSRAYMFFCIKSMKTDK